MGALTDQRTGDGQDDRLGDDPNEFLLVVSPVHSDQTIDPILNEVRESP